MVPDVPFNDMIEDSDEWEISVVTISIIQYKEQLNSISTKLKSLFLENHFEDIAIVSLRAVGFQV